MASKISEPNFDFCFNDQLPRIFEVVNHIIDVMPNAIWYRKGSETNAIRTVIQLCGKKLLYVWQKAFGSEFIKSRAAAEKHIRKHLDTYTNSVSITLRIRTLIQFR